jgi:hypothetical protein
VSWALQEAPRQTVTDRVLTALAPGVYPRRVTLLIEPCLQRMNICRR